MKRLLMILASLFLVFGLVACSSGGSVTDEQPDDGIVDDNTDNDTDLLQLTLAELSEYDGMDGSDAYIAVDGVIYDVTNVSAWSGGSHNGLYAGQDLTEEINNLSPHGTSVLDDLDIVGELVE